MSNKKTEAIKRDGREKELIQIKNLYIVIETNKNMLKRGA